MAGDESEHALRLPKCATFLLFSDAYATNHHVSWASELNEYQIQPKPPCPDLLAYAVPAAT